MARALSAINPADLTAGLRELEEVASESVLRQAAVAGARVVHAEILRRAPIGNKTHKRKGREFPPGTLRKALLIAYDKEQSVPGKLATYMITFGKDAFYWQFIEHGTAHIAPDPFFRPGYDTSKNAAAAEVATVIERKAQEIGSR